VPVAAQQPPPPPPAVTASDKAELGAADKAAKAKDWAGALARYQAAARATPSPQAQLGAANALYQLGRLGEAYEAYDEAQRDYGAKLSGGEKGLVAARLKELAGKTGWLSVRVNETGAQVDVDTQSLGTSPVPALVRVPVGTHDVKITKPGFVTFANRAEVTADGKAVVDATMAREATAGHVSVQATEPLRVMVDGVDVGGTPWEGDLPAGAHEIAGRSSTANALPQKITLNAGDRTTVSLVVAETAAHLQVRTSDGKGVIYVDGAVKAEGAFAADVSPGQHTVAVTREGYERFDKTFTLAPHETAAETVTLTPVAAQVTSGTAERAFEGIYGGLGLTGLFGVGGQGTELETGCATLGATSCQTPNPLGGGAFGYVGWTWNPVGFELLLGGSGDTVQQTAHFSGNAPSSSTALPISTPARDEKFTFARFGGLAALRVRASFQTGPIRGTFAGGLGFAYKEMIMKRDATATDGSGRKNTYVPDSLAYSSPAITLEGAAQLRVSQTVAIALGLEVWADNASVWGNNASPPSVQHNFLLARNSTPAQIPTPQYHFASGSQIFLGPFLGMQFGP